MTVKYETLIEVFFEDKNPAFFNRLISMFVNRWGAVDLSVWGRRAGRTLKKSSFQCRKRNWRMLIFNEYNFSIDKSSTGLTILTTVLTQEKSKWGLLKDGTSLALSRREGSALIFASDLLPLEDLHSFFKSLKEEGLINRFIDITDD